MATLQWGTARTGLGTGLHILGASRRALLVRIASASSFSVTFRGEPVGTDPTTSSPQLGYRNTALSPDAAGVAGATAITADGLYEVRAGAGVSVALHVTAGTATVTVVPDDA